MQAELPNTPMDIVGGFHGELEGLGEVMAEASCVGDRIQSHSCSLVLLGTSVDRGLNRPTADEPIGKLIASAPDDPDGM